MGGLLRGIVFLVVVLLTVGQPYVSESDDQWVPLHVDSRDRIRKIIKSEVESRKGFSTREEDRRISARVEAQRQKEASAYKAAIDAATSEYRRSKKRLDDLEAQFQTASYDFEELNKTVINIQTTIQNIDNQIARYEYDRQLQKDSLQKWLKTKKQGEVAVAVIYTRGFLDSAHKLERLADQVSAPLMAKHMGTYIQSRSNVLDSVLTKDFIRAVEEGTAKWNRDEPLLMALMKGPQGTTYLRIKRYELYPYQAPDTKPSDAVSRTTDARARILNSMNDLKLFLTENNFAFDDYNFSRVESILREINLINKQAEEDQREQLISFSERIGYLAKKLTSARSDKTFQLKNLSDKQAKLVQSKKELEVIRLKKDDAGMSFKNAQAALQEKKRVHESIIVKSSLVTVKRSETPAEASAEAVIEGLKDVLNDARLQHSSSTTDVVDAKLVAEQQTQSVTDARILALCPISFLNEGDAIRVKMAFRVRTVLDDKPLVIADASTDKGTHTPPVVKPSPSPAKPPADAPAHKTVTVDKPKPTNGGMQIATPIPQDSKPELSHNASIQAGPVMAVEALSCQFNLEKVTRSGGNLTFYVKATNKYGRTQYLLFYDESCECDRSMISGTHGKPISVSKVYLWQGDKKTDVTEVSRGLPMEPDSTIDVELVFKEMPHATKLILKPVVGTRKLFIYSWWSDDVTFKNFPLP